MGGFQNAQGFPNIPSGVLQATPGLGTADDSTVINNALSNTGLAILKGSINIQNPIVPVNDSCLTWFPNTTINWTGANGGYFYQQPTSGGVNIRQTAFGIGGSVLNLNPGTATGMNYLDLHSCQQCYLEGFQFIASPDQTGTFIKMRCDVTNTNNSYGGNRNCIDNVIGKIHGGKNGTMMDLAGAALSSQVVTLNNFYAIDALNQGVALIVLGDYVDNNVYYGSIRGSLNQNNGVGLNEVAGGTGNTYTNVFQVFSPDTFAGKTGRQALILGSATSRNAIYYYFNNPAAEVAPTLAADSWSIDHADFGETGASTPANSSSFRRLSSVSSFRNLTYSSSMTPDVTLTNTNGIYRITVTDGNAMTMNAPAGASTYDMVQFNFLNSSGGAMGVITWNAAYKVAGGATGFAGPANGKYKSIQFFYDGTNWIEMDRSAADVG